MRKGIATVSVSGTLGEKLTAVARAKFDGVEIFESDLITSSMAPEEVRQRVADLGLTIDLYQPFRDFEAMPAELFARNLRRAERKLDLMARLGATNLLVCSNVSPAAVDDDALAADHLRQLAELAHERGLRIAYEALAWGRRVSDYRHAYAIVAAADHPHLGVCLDSFHILSRGHDPSAIRDIPWQRIFFVQLADAPRLAMDVLRWSRHHRCFPGQGGFDLPEFVEHVLAAGYRGPLSLEVFSDIFRRADPSRTATDAMRSLLFLEDALRARFAPAGESPDPSAVRERVELFHPPAPAPLIGYQFVELATRPEALAVTESVLRSLGFHLAGRHRSKAVRLWRQGEVNVLTNAEAEAQPAAGAGPVLAAIGAGTGDPLRSANRADAFLARVLPRRRGRGEIYLPSVRVTDGTSFFFCPPPAGGDPAWLVDFLLEDPSEQRSAGLTGIDHVALSLPFDQYDEAVLFFRAVLGLEPAESLELPEPRGLIRSRALTSPDGRIRLVLNMPQLGGSASVGASGRPAVGMHHVAFGCDDIFATAAALRECGTRFLPVSDNYYADVAARWELPDHLVDALRQAGVLYDRAPHGGEFYQLYTDVVGDRLFVEVVQRSGGYDGYGAVSVATRMAAQR